MIFLHDATIHIDHHPSGQGLSQNVEAITEACRTNKPVGFTQPNGSLLSLRFPSEAESDTLLKLLAAPKPPTMLIVEPGAIRAWFALTQACNPQDWQAIGHALATTLGGTLEPRDATHNLPGVHNTLIYQRDAPYTLLELQRAYLATPSPAPANSDGQDNLREAIQVTDLPALVAHHYPESGAKPSTQGAVKAVWRGDENPSLSLFQAEDGTWLYRDHGTNETGNSFGFLVDILGLSKKEAAEAIKGGSFTSLNVPPAPVKAPPSPTKAAKPHVRSTIVKTYAYKDADFRLLFEVVRFNPKRFAQRRRDAETGKWIWGLSAGGYSLSETGHYTKVKNGATPEREFPNVEPILYHLPELLASRQYDLPVYLVEGEKDVETLEFHGFLATCNPMGSGKWRTTYTDALKDRHVVLLPDNDEAGRDHATLVQGALEPKVKSLKIISLPDLKKGEDVSDWFEKGHTREELTELVNPNQGVSEETFEEMQVRLWEAYNTKQVPSFTHPFSQAELEPHNAIACLKSALDQPQTKDNRKVIHNAYAALSQAAP